MRSPPEEAVRSSKPPDASKRLGRSRERLQCWLCAAVLILLVAIIYWRTASFDFVYDDEDYVVNDPLIRSLGHLAEAWTQWDRFEQYHPFTFTTFYVEYQLWQLNPSGYHITNWLLHAAAVLLSWRLLVRLTVPGAWLAAAFFAVHPVWPALGFFYIYGLMISFVYDHLQYHAIVVFFALVAAVMSIMDTRLANWLQWLFRAAVGFLVGALLILAHSCVGVFQNPRILNEDILAKNPDAIIAEVNLAVWYERQGRDAESVPHRRRAIEVQGQLAQKKPDIAGYRGQLAAYWVRLGLAERRLGNWDAAEVAFRNAIDIDEKLVVERPASAV
jgi:tetratricopeptide (TPR) repeat protein